MLFNQKVCAKREWGFLICSNAASRLAPSREFGCRVGRMVDGSPPGLAQRIRKAPAMVVRRPLLVGTAGLVALPDHLAQTVVRPKSGKRLVVRKRDQTGPCDGLRLTKVGRRSSQPLLVLSGPILAEIQQPSAPHDPRTLGMVQGATRHFEQIPAKGGNPVRFSPPLGFRQLALMTRYTRTY